MQSVSGLLNILFKCTFNLISHLTVWLSMWSFWWHYGPKSLEDDDAHKNFDPELKCLCSMVNKVFLSIFWWVSSTQLLSRTRAMFFCSWKFFILVLNNDSEINKQNVPFPCWLF